MRFGLPTQMQTAYLLDAVEVFLTSAIEVVRPGVPSYDPITGAALAGSTGPGYTGKAQISRSASAGAVMSGESYTELATVAVRIPALASPVPRVEDQVIVTACAEDAALVGEVLRVIDVTYGGMLAPLRTLTCTFATATPFNPGS